MMALSAPQRGESSSEPSGNFTGRNLVGGPSGPGFRRPVVVVQGDALNRSRIATVICIPLTSNLKWALAPGNVRLSARITGLPKESVANVSQIIAIDKILLKGRVGT